MRVGLNGQVVGNDDAEIYRWFGFTDVCCPADLRKALEDCPEGEALELEINSGGGSVYAGFEMYSLLRNAGRPVTAEVQSIAASAMSVVIAGCDRVMMSPVANIMVHRASVRTEGNSETHTQRAQWLDTIDRSILEAYTRKCGERATAEELAGMMERETFLTAEEAVEKGFADGILESDPEEADPMAAVASAYRGAGAALGLGTLPPVDDLRRRMTEEGLTGAEGTPPVQNTENAKKEREKDMTLEELMAEYPELMAQAASQAADQAAAQERERIAAINALAMPGFEEQIQAAIDDPAKTAGEVAMEIVAAIKAAGGPSDWMGAARADAQDSGANSVGGAAQPGEKELTPEEAQADAKAAMKTYKGEDK